MANAASADGLRVREIRRKVNVDDIDRADTVKWYANESVRYTVAPHWRDGTHLAIPETATASWIVADENGTNWLARYGEINAESNVVFSFSAGEGALPEEHEYTSFAALLDGTNLLGVIDRVNVEVLWHPQDDVVPVEPPASGWPEILAWVQDAVEGFIATNAAAIAELEAAVATNAADIATNAAAIQTHTDAIASNAADIATNAAAIADLESGLAVATNAFDLAAAMEPQTVRMDLFDIEFTPRLATTGDTTGAVVQAFSILAAPVATSNYFGYLLTPNIHASTSETNAMRYRREADSSTFLTNSLGEVFWSPNSVASVLSAYFGTASKFYSGKSPLTNAAVATNWVYAGDASGSLRAAFDGSALGVNTNASRDYWTGSGSERATNANFFLPGWDFRCMSKHPYERTVTLVTPRHGICAAHWAPAVGTMCYFGASWPYYTVTALRKFDQDRCVVRFSGTVSGVQPALLLDGDAAWRNNLTLPENVADVPGLYALTFHAGGRGSITRIPSALDGSGSLDLRPATNALPSSVAGIDFVGGDSGHPTFLLPPGTNRPVLVSCNWFTYGAGNGGGGPDWTSAESWNLLTNAIAEWGDSEVPERYDLSAWPDYVTPAPPQ